MVSLFITIPLTIAFVISVTGKLYKRLPEIFGGLSCLVLVVLSFVVLQRLQAANFSPIVYKVGNWGPPVGICMVVDGLSMLILIIVNIVALMSVIFSFSYMDKYTDNTKYYTLFMLMLSGMNGIVITGDLFNMFVFLEIATIASASLVAFGTEQEELEASFRYLVLGGLAALLVLLGIAVLYAYTSSLNMADVSQILMVKHNTTVIGFVTVLFIMGFGLKAAVVPFHAWLPDAHSSAPAPISAMLSGVLIKSLGIYALIRVLFNVLGVG